MPNFIIKTHQKDTRYSKPHLFILNKGMNSLDDLLQEVERLLHNHTTKTQPELDRADTAPQPA